MQPDIQNPQKLNLPAGTELVFAEIFRLHQRIIIEKEFGRGFGESRVFMVHPIKNDQTAELRTVIKIAPANLIKKEEEAYRHYIHHKLPNTVQIQNDAVYPPNCAWGGIRYSLVGSNTFKVEDLGHYCLIRDVKDILFTLARLYEVMGHIWQHRHTDDAFLLQPGYDQLLPVNLLIKPVELTPEVEPQLLKPDNYSLQLLKSGDYVRLEGFLVTELNQDKKEVTLNLPPAPDNQYASYRLRLAPVQPEQFCLNKTMRPFTGVVVKTRYELLVDYVRPTLDPNLDLSADTVTLTRPNQTITLPNPLAVLPGILGQPLSVFLACIHGDLNLKNILVDADTREVTLIDFATARQNDHVLHDFLRLETGMMTQLLTGVIDRNRLPVAETIYTFYEQLHHAGFYITEPFIPQLPHPALQKTFAMLLTVRQTARQYLFNAHSFTEYYQGLTIYLLGSLKFKDLNDTAKQIAFWGAATAQQLISKPSLLSETPKLAAFARPVSVKTPTGIRMLGCFYEDGISEQEIQKSMPEIAGGTGLKTPLISAFPQHKPTSFIAQESDETAGLLYQPTVKALLGQDYCVFLQILSARNDDYCAPWAEVMQALQALTPDVTLHNLPIQFDRQVYTCREIPNTPLAEKLPPLFDDESRPDAVSRLQGLSLPLICAYWSHLNRYALFPASLLPANPADQDRVIFKALDDLARLEIYRRKLRLGYEYYQQHYDPVKAIEDQAIRQMDRAWRELNRASAAQRRQMLSQLNRHFINLSRLAVGVSKYNDNLAQPNYLNLKGQLQSWHETPLAEYPTLSDLFLPEAEQIVAVLAEFSKRIANTCARLSDLIQAIRDGE
ncbi:MAG: hypothetical protein JW953_02725 [Anaerolineae bacterium]|nr:hypothetical protein [Anaerolineae bacterium]